MTLADPLASATRPPQPFPELNFHYALGRPTARARFKAQPADFVVHEQLNFSPTGDGEHWLLQVEKTGLNTAFVAEQLAQQAGLPLRQVSYAGRKDRHAVTTQWFGVHDPKQVLSDPGTLGGDGFRVVAAVRHGKKLRPGCVAQNDFALVLREVDGGDDIAARLDAVRRHGVPNYFGAQRFGVRRTVATGGEGDEAAQETVGGNLALAQQMLDGTPIRNRNKRSVVISAMRSWLFNEAVSRRFAQGLDTHILPGDALNLRGSHSFFIADDAAPEAMAALQQRLQSRDIDLTAPLWGAGDLPTRAQARTREQALASDYPALAAALAALGLSHERRAVHLYPEALTMRWLAHDVLALQFSLPSGAFATSVLRELCRLNGDDIA